MSYQYLKKGQVTMLENCAAGLAEYVDGAIESLITIHGEYDPHTRPKPSEVNKELQQLNSVLKGLSLDAREHLKEQGSRSLNMLGMARTEPYMRLLDFVNSDVERLIKYSAETYRRNLNTADDTQDTSPLEIREALLFHIRWINQEYALSKFISGGALYMVLDIILTAASDGLGRDVTKQRGLTSNARLIKDALYK